MKIAIQTKKLPLLRFSLAPLWLFLLPWIEAEYGPENVMLVEKKAGICR